jgi:hypothetical protein
VDSCSKKWQSSVHRECPTPMAMCECSKDNGSERERVACRTPRGRRTRTGKFGSSGAAAVAAVVHEETAAIEDVQSFLDESAKHEVQMELAVAKRELEFEQQNNEQLQAALLDTQRRLEEKEKDLVHLKVYRGGAKNGVKVCSILNHYCFTTAVSSCTTAISKQFDFSTRLAPRVCSAVNLA